MNLLSLFWTFASLVGIFYSAVFWAETIPACVCIFAWAVAFLWAFISYIYIKKFAKTNTLIAKIHKENSEFAEGLVSALNSQAENIKQLQRKKAFLMMAAENTKEVKNDKN